LGRVPGLVIRNRQNYAQDLQISVRGYGARATFGVRGVRLFVDGIPASAPDGSGQAANFPLGSADRVEVVRGPMAALYGASSGGALLLYTEDGQQPSQWRTGVVAGSDGLWRASTQVTGQTGTAQAPGWSYALDLSGFATDGTRPQSAADRSTANMKLSRLHEGGRTVLVFNRHSSFALDPQGLDRAAFDANPEQTNAGALEYNTRKSVTQTQLGLAFEQALGNGHKLELMGYGGQRQADQDSFELRSRLCE
jgi:iron complex outermembrane receptor protein